MRKRGELVERSFAHTYDTGGMRWTHLKGHRNILKRLFIHAAVNLPLFVYIVTRRNPFRHYKGMPPALVTGFSTGSTIVTLPLTMEAVTQNSKVTLPFL